MVQPSSFLKQKTEKNEYLGILTDTVQMAGLVTAVRREFKPQFYAMLSFSQFPEDRQNNKDEKEKY